MKTAAQVLIVSMLVLALDASAQFKDHKDLTYATVDGREMKLDVREAVGVDGPAPLVVWVHGGAWRGGSWADFGNAGFLAREGFAVASISYRLSQQAKWPAQIQDCKAAIRWLRANAKDYNIDPDRIGVWGASAGGHLVAMLGTSAEVEAFDVGEHLDQSSAVQAVCDWFGPTDFLRMNDMPGAMDHNAPDSPESQLVGGAIQENKEAVAAANPITYVNGNEPPFFIMHGDKDNLVIYPQSELLQAALDKAKVPSKLYIVKGGGHGFGGATEDSPEDLRKMVASFFKETLQASHIGPTAQFSGQVIEYAAENAPSREPLLQPHNDGRLMPIIEHSANQQRGGALTVIRE